MITVARKAFTDALAAVAKIVEARATLPILSHVMLTPREATWQAPLRRLELVGTDLDTQILLTIDASFDDGDPTVCVDAKRLLATIKTLPKSILSLTFEAGMLVRPEIPPIVDESTGLETTQAMPETRTVESLKINGGVKLTALPSDDFPVGTEVTEGRVEVPGLIAALDCVAPVVSHDETRYAMNGVLLDTKKKHGCAVATDGHRMFVATLPGLEALDVKGDLILHRRVVDLLIGPLKKLVIEELAVGDGFVTIPLKSGSLKTRRVEGTFPSYTQVIPKSLPHSITVDREQLTEMARAAYPMTNDRNHPICIRMADGKVLLVARDNEASAEFELTTATYTRRCLLGMNDTYLLGVLEQTTTKTVTLRYPDPGEKKTEVNGPIVVQERGFTAVIMPMRLSETLEWVDEAQVEREAEVCVAVTQIGVAATQDDVVVVEETIVPPPVTAAPTPTAPVPTFTVVPAIYIGRPREEAA